MILKDEYLTIPETKDLFCAICNYETGLQSKKELYFNLLAIFYDQEKINNKELDIIYDTIKKEL